MALFDRILRSEHRDPDDVRMTLGEHLDELRTRLIRALVALVLGGVVCFYFRDIIVGVLTTPLSEIMVRYGYSPDVVITDVTEAFMADFQLALILGFILTAPYILWQLWGFVAAGLYAHERKWVRRFVPVSIALFFVGAIFYLVVVMPIFLDFFIGYKPEIPPVSISVDFIGHGASAATQPAAWPSEAPLIRRFPADPENPPNGAFWYNLSANELRVRIDGKTLALGPMREPGHSRVTPMIGIRGYLISMLQMAAAFGIGFQVPVVVALLATIGIATSVDLARVRKYVWFGIAVAAAIITPSPDVTSMMLLFVPMVLLYEVGLMAARFLEKERASSEPT